MVLALLGFIDGQEQDSWKTIWLWPNLKDRWAVIDDDPPERFAPPPTQRTRVRRGDNDLFPLKAHGTTIDASLPGYVTTTPSKPQRQVNLMVQWCRLAVRRSERRLAAPS